MEDNKLFEKYGLTVDSGKILFQEGDGGDKMYIIQEGNIRISKQIGGKEHILAVLGKGDFFGEMAIVNQVKRSATATAIGTVKLLAFNREGFLGMIEKNARIALNVIDKLCRRLQHTNNQIQHLVKRNTKGLIALNLYYAFAENGFEQARLEYHKLSREISLNLEIPQDAVLDFIENLASTRVVKTEDNLMFLLDRDKLHSLAESASGN
ncbi:Crp/Fnr family transcriptional regulator [Marispirochaeta aestuarii]|uniref:Crp/Fnr family transcriptional regulator n=1 Tax=Marispirochaeta aestuarii TaxID=1963862 RepID=A0A1Y1RYI0_9SPIO|nr:cyclic nucleotide-binding domain-containing protein [Marispirochaeta aestuarii]ORC34862.1 Crp/Fnr family transcriptional regulator [Marispirochaeta aestuarii]